MTKRHVEPLVTGLMTKLITGQFTGPQIAIKTVPTKPQRRCTFCEGLMDFDQPRHDCKGEQAHYDGKDVQG